MLYTSSDNRHIKDIKKLSSKKYRDKSSTFLIEGEHLVLEAYKAGKLKELILDKDKKMQLDVETSYATSNILSYISNLENPSDVFGICTKLDEGPIGNRVLILDNIQDPGNLGTIIRSAVAFHIDTLILSEDTVDLYNPKVLRSTQGLIFHLNIIFRNVKETVNELKKDDYKIYGTKVTNGSELKTLEKKEKICIIMGNEGNGVKGEILDLCDDYIYIKMSPLCESLNVGVATSIILYELDK